MRKAGCAAVGAMIAWAEGRFRDGIMDRTTPQAPRYGDYPVRFWNAEPDAASEVTSEVTLARLLMRARADTVARLVSPALLRERLDSLEIPTSTRIFWRLVLAGVTDSRGGSSSRP